MMAWKAETERARYSTTGPSGISPSPSQRCVAAIHDTGMNTATKANKALTPTKRSRITSTLSDFVMASYPWPSSSCILGLPTPIEYRLVDRRKMRSGGTDGLQRSPGRAHPANTGPAQKRRGEEDVRRDRLPAQREPARRRQEGLAARPARPGAERRGAEGSPRQRI